MIDISPLEKAIAQLQESLNYADSDLAKYDARLARQFRSAAIQAFEYTYELSHKMLKRYLEATEPTPESIDAMSFQELIRTGAEKGLLLHSWDVWHFYRQCRSITSHTYDEEKADDVFSRLKDFLEEAAFLCAQIKKRQTPCSLHMKNVQGIRSSAARAVPLARLRGEVLMCERYMLELAEKDLAIVKGILQQYIPNYTVWAFGSRVQGRVKPFSDLDLAIIGTEPLPTNLEIQLKYAFDESLLPIKVDIVDWQRITPAFQKIIEKKYHVIQPHEETA